MMDMPQTNLKDYVIKCRQANMPDSRITETLKKSNWPEDIIESVLRDADSIVQPVPEPEEEQNLAPLNPDTEKKQDKSIGQPKPVEPKIGKKFSMFAFISFLLSPIPIIGMIFCMIATDYTKKKNLSGVIFPVFGMVINISIMVYIIWIVFMVILPGDKDLTGFAAAINNLFNFIN